MTDADLKTTSCTVERKARILFVDDDDFLVQLNQQRLSRLGYDVVATTSSTDALEIFQKEPDTFDLVLTDYAMPDLTGLDLAAELLKTRPTIPIILCTGYVAAISPETVHGAGIKALLLKPLGKMRRQRLSVRYLPKTTKNKGCSLGTQPATRNLQPATWSRRQFSGYPCESGSWKGRDV